MLSKKPPPPSAAVFVDEGAALWPAGMSPAVSTLYDGSEIAGYVWSTPIAFGVGPGGGVMLGPGVIRTEDILAQLKTATLTSPIAAWSVFFDGADTMSPPPAQIAEFGFLDDLGAADGVGVKPGAFRFCIAFVAGATTKEAFEVDRIEIPWTPAPFDTPQAP